MTAYEKLTELARKEIDLKRERNLPLMQLRIAAFNEHQGPRVGDFIRLPDIHPRLGKWTRLTHDHGDLLQTGGLGGSYYLSGGG